MWNVFSLILLLQINLFFNLKFGLEISACKFIAWIETCWFTCANGSNRQIEIFSHAHVNDGVPFVMSMQSHQTIRKIFSPITCLHVEKKSPRIQRSPFYWMGESHAARCNMRCGWQTVVHYACKNRMVIYCILKPKQKVKRKKVHTTANIRAD